jgi:hypothetical protein
MIWRFSDGTAVSLGGSVEGASLFAQHLRDRIESGRVLVDIWPPPSDEVVVNFNDAALLNRWLERELDLAIHVRGWRVKLRSAPKGIPALPLPPWAGVPTDPDVVY